MSEQLGFLYIYSVCVGWGRVGTTRRVDSIFSRLFYNLFIQMSVRNTCVFVMEGTWSRSDVRKSYVCF